MKAEPFLLASSMTCVMAQRVLRKICDNCTEKYAPSEVVIEEMKKVLGPLYDAYVSQLGGKPVMLSRGRKCEKCGETGYKGRIAIFEVLKITEKIGKLILERAPAIQIEQVAVTDGWYLWNKMVI
jgi:type II secretory ATPase GspE/PulE/Tfp pilus assembly ATPase PilB-like protein